MTLNEIFLLNTFCKCFFVTVNLFFSPSFTVQYDSPTGRFYVFLTVDRPVFESVLRIIYPHLDISHLSWRHLLCGLELRMDD